MPTLDAADLDHAYTHLCRTMTRLGEADAPLFLARFALLAITRIGDAGVVRALTDSAAAFGVTDRDAPVPSVGGSPARVRPDTTNPVGTTPGEASSTPEDRA